MALLLHIIIALTSVGYTTFVYVAPTRTRLGVSYGLIGATVVSGFYLVISTSVSILHTCIAGLLYVGLALAGTFAAQHKLAAITVRNRE
jgi:hypothetical protein